MIVKILKTAAGVLLAAAVFSCQNPSGLGSEPDQAETSTLNFRQLSTMGYMGGSLLFNGADFSGGHLQAGAQIAVRLGFLGSETNSADQAAVSDVPHRALLGEILVTAASKEQLSFNYSLYSSEGLSAASGTLTLALGESADLNGDSLPDLLYREADRNRFPEGKQAYLEFISSQENLHTAMFSVVEESYEGRSLPSGLFGINPYGVFLYSSQDGTVSGRSLETMKSGDIVLDAQAGAYKKIHSPEALGSNRSLAGAESSEILEEEAILDVLPLAYFNMEGDGSRSLDPAESRALSWDQFRTERAAILDDFADLKTFKTWAIQPVPALKTLFNIETQNMMIKLGAAASGSIEWDRLKAKVKIAALVDTGEIQVRLSKSVVQELLEPLDEELTTSFTIGPILVDLGAYVSSGITLNAGIDTPKIAELQGGFTGMYGAQFSASLSCSLSGVKLSKDFDSINKSTAYSGIQLGDGSKSGAWVSLTPWVKVGGTAKIFKVFYGRVGPTITFENLADVKLENGNTLVGKATGTLGLGMSAEAGIKIKLPFNIGKFSKSWDWDSPKAEKQIYSATLFRIPVL